LRGDTAPHERGPDLRLEALLWFSGQALALALAIVAGWRLSGMAPQRWKAAAALATGLILTWPLARLFPAQAVRCLGARPVSFIEVTGIVIPAALLFTIAARNVAVARQPRIIAALMAACCLYFVRNGAWMFRPPLADLGPTRMQGSICLQSTPYTCVAASLVTMLKAFGYPAGETEMARLTYTERYYGTTDTRALAALRARLTGEPVEVCFETMDFDRLKLVPKPCVVSLKRGYFVSHMVPVLSISDSHVRLGDPLTGITEVSTGEFLRSWPGRGIYLVDHRLLCEGCQ
jgi:hypothetical protein